MEYGSEHPIFFFSLDLNLFASLIRCAVAAGESASPLRTFLCPTFGLRQPALCLCGRVRQLRVRVHSRCLHFSVDPT